MGETVGLDVTGGSVGEAVGLFVGLDETGGSEGEAVGFFVGLDVTGALVGLDVTGALVGLDVTGGGVGAGPQVPNVVASELANAPPDATSSVPNTTS